MMKKWLTFSLLAFQSCSLAMQPLDVALDFRSSVDGSKPTAELNSNQQALLAKYSSPFQRFIENKTGKVSSSEPYERFINIEGFNDLMMLLAALNNYSNQNSSFPELLKEMKGKRRIDLQAAAAYFKTTDLIKEIEDKLTHGTATINLPAKRQYIMYEMPGTAPQQTMAIPYQSIERINLFAILENAKTLKASIEDTYGPLESLSDDQELEIGQAKKFIKTLSNIKLFLAAKSDKSGFHTDRLIQLMKPLKMDALIDLANQAQYFEMDLLIEPAVIALLHSDEFIESAATDFYFMRRLIEFVMLPQVIDQFKINLRDEIELANVKKRSIIPGAYEYLNAITLSKDGSTLAMGDENNLNLRNTETENVTLKIPLPGRRFDYLNFGYKTEDIYGSYSSPGVVKYFGVFISDMTLSKPITFDEPKKVKKMLDGMSYLGLIYADGAIRFVSTSRFTFSPDWSTDFSFYGNWRGVYIDAQFLPKDALKRERVATLRSLNPQMPYSYTLSIIEVPTVSQGGPSLNLIAQHTISNLVATLRGFYIGTDEKMAIFHTDNTILSKVFSDHLPFYYDGTHTGNINAFRVSDKKYVLSTSPDRMLIHSVKTGLVLNKFKKDDIQSGDLSGDGRIFAFSSVSSMKQKASVVLFERYAPGEIKTLTLDDLMFIHGKNFMHMNDKQYSWSPVWNTVSQSSNKELIENMVKFMDADVS